LPLPQNKKDPSGALSREICIWTVPTAGYDLSR
jgi:hypothetical protein